MASAYDPGDSESIFTRRRQRRKRNMLTFAYDIGVNLLANLLALAIGALVAQATGVIQRNPALTRTSVAILLTAAAAAAILGATLMVEWARLHGGGWRHLLWMALFVVPVFGIRWIAEDTLDLPSKLSGLILPVAVLVVLIPREILIARRQHQPIRRDYTLAVSLYWGGVALITLLD